MVKSNFLVPDIFLHHSPSLPCNTRTANPPLADVHVSYLLSLLHRGKASQWAKKLSHWVTSFRRW